MTSVPVPGAGQLSVPAVQPPPTLAGLSPEVLTVSSLLSMPAVWNAVIQRALPVNVLLERYLVVLLTCALVAELVRRLGEGGALGPASPVTEETPAPRATAGTPKPAPFDEPTTGLDDLTGFDDLGDLDAAPLALDAPASDLSDLGDLGDLGDLAPLDLDADPFAEPA